jgi:hypothetical protein
MLLLLQLSGRNKLADAEQSSGDRWWQMMLLCSWQQLMQKLLRQLQWEAWQLPGHLLQ